MDYILSPAYPGAAAVMGESHYWNYTAIWNLLDLPCAVFPSGITVDSEIDVLTEKDRVYVPRSTVEEREWRKYTDTGPERYVGAPVALQVVGRHFRDEETLAAARFVEEVIKDGARGAKL